MASKLSKWIEHPEELNSDTLYELRGLIRRYPYVGVLYSLYLKNLYILHDEQFGSELRRCIVYVGDRRKLFRWIEEENIRLEPSKEYMKEEEEENCSEKDRTMFLIDSFLKDSPEEEIAALEFECAADYVIGSPRKVETTLSVHKEEIEDTDEQLLPSILNKENTKEEQEHKEIEEGNKQLTEKEDVNSETEFFTETLAKIYIKQERYERALEILKKISLKYPKKNIYFADQIRYLEKLIINAKSKK